MIDNTYKNAFKEVHVILENTENKLVEKVPQKFLKFLQDNMNKDYKVNINLNEDIDKQKLLQETEDILSLIYRSYWATDEEKIELYNKGQNKPIESEKNQYKNINEIFEKRENLNNVTLDSSLIVIQKESFIKKLFKKILSIFNR